MTEPLPVRPATDACYWLGQAGFWIDLGGWRLLIDPYLSDSLARKYAGREFAHQRLVPIPIRPDELPRPDLVLITHAHGDHMDADTLAPLAARFRDLPFVVPRAVLDQARTRIGPEALLRPVNSGETLDCGAGLRITAFPAAHEQRDFDADGNDRFLGYGISAGGKRLYHSGDTIPFEGLTELVRQFAPQLALLPINGRDDFRRSNGVPGNLTEGEALALCREAGVPRLVPHHWGMFGFNTADAGGLERIRGETAIPDVVIPSLLVPIPII